VRRVAQRVPAYARRLLRALRGAAGLAVLPVLSACVSSPPQQVADLCAIFEEKGGWYWDARHARERWDIPIPVLMAFTHQESTYRGDARPPRNYILWVIPWGRESSAFGYAQATDATWREYREATGRRFADRDDFDDAMDFIGWYNDRTARSIGLPRDDAYSLYLAYHEGMTGFQRGTWRSKGWLKDAARRVAHRASVYRSQLRGCEDELDDPWWWPF